ncbi:hypothetical protein D3C81_1893340 [compost metagenome]
MHGQREAAAVSEHQFAHVLPRNADDVGNVRQADEVGCNLHQARLRDDALDVHQRAQQRRFGSLRLAGKLQGQSAG